MAEKEERIDGEQPRFKCCVNGSTRTLSLHEALQLAKQVRFLWIWVTDYFRSGFGDDLKEGHVENIAKPSGREFARHLLTHGSLPLLINDRRLADERGDSPSRDQFHGLAAKFGKLFLGKKMHEHAYVPDDEDVLQPAYRVKLGMDWLIVADVDPTCSISRREVDWVVFQQLPEEQPTRR